MPSFRTATYDAYGNEIGSTGSATTSLGYDGQYTNADTGLIYLRAREYDPATAQFLSVDPKMEETNAVYEYAKDDPLTVSDPTGMCAASAASYRSATKKECEDLLGELEYKAKELHKRFDQIFATRNQLGASEVKKYVKTFNQKQANLRKEVNRFGAQGCEKKNYGLQVPAEVYEALEVKVNVQIQVVPVV